MLYATRDIINLVKSKDYKQLHDLVVNDHNLIIDYDFLIRYILEYFRNNYVEKHIERKFFDIVLLINQTRHQIKPSYFYHNLHNLLYFKRDFVVDLFQTDLIELKDIINISLEEQNVPPEHRLKKYTFAEHMVVSGLFNEFRSLYNYHNFNRQETMMFFPEHTARSRKICFLHTNNYIRFAANSFRTGTCLKIIRDKIKE